jgi:hypothetical protein
MTGSEFEIPKPSLRASAVRMPASRGDRRLMLFGAAGCCAVLLVAGVWAMRGHHGPVPVIEADSNPVRVKPDNPGGMAADGQSGDILAGVAAQRAGGVLAPPAEAPALAALHAQEAQGSAPQAAAPVQTVTAPAMAPPVAQTAPLAAPLPAPARPKPPAAASVTPPKPADHPAPDQKAGVQIAALETEAAAHTEWGRLAKRNPEIFNGRHPVITKFERDGKVFWRLRASGFAGKDAASAFCAKLKASGSGCAVLSG